MIIENIPFCGAVKRRTVHEMAKDEARHGKGFEGIIKSRILQELVQSRTGSFSLLF